jgi:hypothetical protein
MIWAGDVECTVEKENVHNFVEIYNGRDDFSDWRTVSKAILTLILKKPDANRISLV